uniref:Histidine kinase n=1 Tax=Heterorhabditis bacteriophora TaxID=37862 RepID=A0A1I7WNB5_HETBA
MGMCVCGLVLKKQRESQAKPQNLSTLHAIPNNDYLIGRKGGRINMMNPVALRSSAVDGVKRCHGIRPACQRCVMAGG